MCLSLGTRVLRQYLKTFIFLYKSFYKCFLITWYSFLHFISTVFFITPNFFEQFWFGEQKIIHFFASFIKIDFYHISNWTPTLQFWPNLNPQIQIWALKNEIWPDLDPRNQDKSENSGQMDILVTHSVVPKPGFSTLNWTELESHSE